MVNSRQKTLLLTLSILTVFLGIFCFKNLNDFEFPLKKELILDSPYLVRDYGNLRYIMDKQRTRIVVIDKNTNIIQNILPSKTNDADTFFCADDFLVDENSFVYVKEGAWDGNRIGREAILVYDQNGNYKTTYLDTSYSTLVNKHKIMLLSVNNGKILYAKKEKGRIFIIDFDTATKAETKQEYLFENAFDFINDMTIDQNGNIYALDKPGNIFKLGKAGKISLIYTAAKNEFPNWIETSASGKILFSDLYNDCITELEPSTGEKSTVIESSGSVTVTPVSFSEIQNPQKNSTLMRKQTLLLAACLLFSLSIIFLFASIVFFFFKSSMKMIQRISGYIVIVVIIVAGTLTFKLTDEFSKIMKVQILAQMENMAYSVANTIKPSTLDSIQTAADFASPEYREMISHMESVIDPKLEVNRNVYCDIFKYDEQHGAYACAYLDQTIGTYFPLTEGETEEIKQIYKTGKAIRSNKDDTSASYTYVSVPVMNDLRKVCGVVSVMIESSVLSNQIMQMRKNVLLGIIITLIFVWLLMGETLSYIISKSQAQLEQKEKAAAGEKAEKVFPYYYIRFMVFALFATYNMTTTFIPMVVMKSASASLGNSVSGFASALPLSINLFAIGLMALFCEGMIRRLGCKKIIIAGTILSAAGNLLIFLFPLSYLVIFLSLILDGIGVGLTTNSMYLLVSQIPDPKNRTSGFTAYNAAQISGINFGMLFGASLAANIGRRAAFPAVTFMWILSAVIFLLLWKSLQFDSKANEKSTEEKDVYSREPKFTTRKIVSFIFNKKIFSFILFVQVPFALMGSFIYYYLPIYSDSTGMSEILVAVLMMLYSMFAIYLGNGLTKLVMEKTGAFAPYAAIILSSAAIVIYAFTETFTGLLTAIFLLGLANGFGRSVNQANFSMLDECGKFGIPKAMGIFNFTDFIGQSFGPTVMALIFLSGRIKVSAIGFSSILIIFLIIHVIITRVSTSE